MSEGAKDLKSDNIGNFREIVPGVLAGAQPKLPGGLAELKAKYGVKTVIKLNDDQYQAEENTCAELGLLFIPVLMSGVELLDDVPLDRVLRAVGVMENELMRPVFIHCAKGADRTGCVNAIFRLRQGWPLNRTLAEMYYYHNAWLEGGFRGAVRRYDKQLREALEGGA